MTDPREVLRDARARLKPIIARLLVRQESAEATLAKLRAEAARLAEEAEAMRAAERAELADALTAAKAEVDAKIELTLGELAQAEAALAEARANAAQLEADEDGVDRARLRQAMDAVSRGAGDALSGDVADAALARVREHAQALEARARLGEELAGEAAGSPAAATDAAAARTTPAADPVADALSTARTQLAALKEARKKRTL